MIRLKAFLISIVLVLITLVILNKTYIKKTEDYYKVNDNSVRYSTAFEKYKSKDIITENITDNLETQERQEEEIENISVHPTVTEDKTLTVQSISNIVKMLDLYRTYEDKTQTICKQFLDNDTTLDINAVVIYNILNIDKTKKTGLDDLVKLKEEERTSRAFSLIALDNSRLLPLKDITEMFNPGYTNSFDISDKINFCKELESGIDSLNDNALIHLKPINELLRTVE